ncbi:hypothetical protein LCGC14_3060200 [marine sediment metagenome]|uniref:HD domain-containing protein n=1 Tax=marine sediment metagenome TaxID=412755 RepID=A0A0F8YRZ8_9ZZZZ
MQPVFKYAAGIFLKSCYKSVLPACRQREKVMEQEQLEKFRVWFDDYAAGFYGQDEFVNANLRLKEEHSRRTCEEMLYLARQLDLSENQKRIAETIALFHDIGRFEQFVRYRTYNDTRSVNHSLLGLEVLRRTKVLEAVEIKERKLIERAVEFHGAKLSSNGGLLAYRDLDHALGLFDSLSASLSINARAEISNMLCPLYCVNRYTAVLRVMMM